MKTSAGHAPGDVGIHVKKRVYSLNALELRLR